jgi:hypothetical protein
MVETLQGLVAPCGRHFGLFRSILHAEEKEHLPKLKKAFLFGRLFYFLLEK